VVRLQIEYLRPARVGQVLRVRVAHLPDSPPALGLFYEVYGPDGTLLCVAETVQIFIDPRGQPFLTPPPEVERLFAEVARREQAGRRAGG
jgi:acyl-CoA thioesterase FadM